MAPPIEKKASRHKYEFTRTPELWLWLGLLWLCRQGFIYLPHMTIFSGPLACIVYSWGPYLWSDRKWLRKDCLFDSKKSSLGVGCTPTLCLVMTHQHLPSHSFGTLLLETGSLPIEITTIERVVQYMLNVQKCPSHRLPRIVWEESKKIPKTHKSKFFCSSWMQDIEEWFGRWDATHLIHDASLDSSVNEAFLQRQFIMKWEKCGGSRFTHYTTHVAPNYKTIFFAKRGNCTHQYMVEPIPLSVIRTIASMRLSSHALRCETGRWGTSDESGRLCTLCPKWVWEFEYHDLIQCSAFDHIRPCFPKSLRPSPQCALSINMYFSHNHNVHSRLQHSLVKFLNIETCYSLSHVSREM